MNKTQVYNIKQEALKDKIPIMQDEGLDFIVQDIIKNDYQKILEIGSATGYSAIVIATRTNSEIITIEKDPERYLKCQENIAKMELQNRIIPILGDARNIEIAGFFDAIIIDAAKAQYMKFFQKYQENLKPNGTIYCDNLDFHHLKMADVSRRTKKLLKKLAEFKAFLENHEQFETKIYHVGDGISVSKRR